MNSKYKSGKSVAKNPTVPISADDPRVAWNKIANTKSRIGSEIDIIGLDGKSLIGGGTNTSNPTGVNGSVNPAGTKEKQYIPPSNGNPGYKTGYGAIVPTNVSSVSASWSGEDLVVTFNWDYSNPSNSTISEFVLEVTADGITRQTPYGSFIPNKTQTAQTLTLTKSLNRSTIGIFRTSITSVCVYAIDSFYNKSTSVCDASIPAYVLSIAVPVITVTAAISGYNVAYTIPSESMFDAIDIVEYESNASTEPTGVTYSRVYFDSISPANVITLNTNSRWVKARFSSDSGVYTAFSAAQKITPTSPVTVDTTGPANVATVTTSGGLDTTGTIGFNGYADISWAAVTTGGIRGYRIRYRPVTSPVSSYSYADSPGTGTAYRLSGLGVGLTYEFAVATYDEYNNDSTSYIAGSNVAISGTPFIGTNVSTTGYFQAGVSGTDTGTFKFGYGVDTGKRGLVFNTHNYWYIDSAQSASLKVGGSTTNYISWDGSTFTIDGDITARGGYFAGNVGIISGGSLYSGTISGGALSGAGYILNSTGLKFNSSTTNDITTINGSTGLFTTTLADIGGWTINSNEIKKVKGTVLNPEGTISLNSTEGYISVSNDDIANQTAGINSPVLGTDDVFWSGSDGPDGTAPFRVNLSGDLFASNATIKGIIRASDGGFGTFSGNTVTKGWTIDTDGIVSAGTGRIKIGDYSVISNNSTDLTISQVSNGANLIKTESVAGATDSPLRLLIGGSGRQVEVVQSAQISGDSTVNSDGTSTAATNAYRSGGLRNIFTSSSGNLSGGDSSLIYNYPSALTGDVLVVYDASTPPNGNFKKIVSMYIKTSAGSTTAAPTTTTAAPTTTTAAPTTTTAAPATVTYYQGNSVCNSSSGCYTTLPNVSGPFTAASLPSDTLTGPSTSRVKNVYRSTSGDALADVAQASCVDCSTTTTAAPATTTTAAPTTTTAAPTTTTAAPATTTTAAPATTTTSAPCPSTSPTRICTSANAAANCCSGGIAGCGGSGSVSFSC